MGGRVRRRAHAKFLPFRQSHGIACDGMTWYAWVLVTVYALATAAHFTLIGQPRRGSYTLTSACAGLVVNAAVVAVVVSLALRGE